MRALLFCALLPKRLSAIPPGSSLLRGLSHRRALGAGSRLLPVRRARVTRGPATSSGLLGDTEGESLTLVPSACELWPGARPQRQRFPTLPSPEAREGPGLERSRAHCVAQASRPSLSKRRRGAACSWQVARMGGTLTPCTLPKALGSQHPLVLAPRGAAAAALRGRGPSLLLPGCVSRERKQPGTLGPLFLPFNEF